MRECTKEAIKYLNNLYASVSAIVLPSSLKMGRICYHLVSRSLE